MYVCRHCPQDKIYTYWSDFKKKKKKSMKWQWFTFKIMCWLFSESEVPAVQEVIKNNLLLAHTCFCTGPEIDDHITRSKANSMEKNKNKIYIYTHTPSLKLQKYITILWLHTHCTCRLCFRVSLVFGKRQIIVRFIE